MNSVNQNIVCYTSVHRFNTSTPELCPPPLTSDPCVTPQREMRFGPYHTDGLVQRVECGDKMIEMFEKRRDFLFQRHTLFAELPSKSQASEHSEDCMEKRPILVPVRTTQEEFKVVLQHQKEPNNE